MPEDPYTKMFLDLREHMGEQVTLIINGKAESGRLANVCLKKGIVLVKEAVDKAAIPIAAPLKSVQIAQ